MPLMIAPTGSPSIMGIIAAPDSDAVWPLAAWKKMGRYTYAPNMAQPERKPSTMQTEKFQDLKRRIGTTGSLAT